MRRSSGAVQSAVVGRYLFTLDESEEPAVQSVEWPSRVGYRGERRPGTSRDDLGLATSPQE